MTSPSFEARLARLERLAELADAEAALAASTPPAPAAPASPRPRRALTPGQGADVDGLDGFDASGVARAVRDRYSKAAQTTGADGWTRDVATGRVVE